MNPLELVINMETDGVVQGLEMILVTDLENELQGAAG